MSIVILFCKYNTEVACLAYLHAYAYNICDAIWENPSDVAKQHFEK